MSNVVLASAVSAAVVVGLAIGWTLGAPHRPHWPVVNRYFHPAGAEVAPTPVAAGEDVDPGWQDRKKLRDGMTDAIEQLKATPCDPDAQAAFMYAIGTYFVTKLQDGRAVGASEDGAPFWRTPADLAITQQLKTLKDRGIIQDGQIMNGMVDRQMGARSAAELARIQNERDTKKGAQSLALYNPTPPYCRRDSTAARRYDH